MNPTTKAKRKKWVVGASFALIAVAILLLGTGLPVCRNCACICENTGSRKGHCEWFFGLHTGQWYHESHIEAFMRKEYPGETVNRWTSYAGTEKNVLGQSISYSHGRPGRIITVPEELLDCFVDGLDPDGRLRLYRLLSSGDEDEIEAAMARILGETVEMKR